MIVPIGGWLIQVLCQGEGYSQRFRASAPRDPPVIEKFLAQSLVYRPSTQTDDTCVLLLAFSEIGEAAGRN